ncbi:TPA: hypothetical protein DF272_02665 [Candidatus Falkowbacteria bacterium]|nr:hypothetical protein [Candidatus Falkowbacteria bacterium]
MNKPKSSLGSIAIIIAFALLLLAAITGGSGCGSLTKAQQYLLAYDDCVTNLNDLIRQVETEDIHTEVRDWQEWRDLRIAYDDVLSPNPKYSSEYRQSGELQLVSVRLHQLFDRAEREHNLSLSSDLISPVYSRWDRLTKYDDYAN